MTLQDFNRSPFKLPTRKNLLRIPKDAIYVHGNKVGYRRYEQDWCYQYIKKIIGTVEQPIVFVTNAWDHWVGEHNCDMILDKEEIKRIKKGTHPCSGQGQLW